MCYVQEGEYEQNKDWINWYYNSNEPVQTRPRKMFSTGGSENWAVSWAGVRYLIDDDPSWFSEYADLMLSGEVGFMGRELGSNTYQSLVTGILIVALNHAQERGHFSLNTKLSKVLRAYWTLLTLSASDTPRAIKCTHTPEGNTDPLAPNLISSSKVFGQYSVAFPGRRSYVNSDCRSSGLQSPLLSLALENPQRDISQLNLDNSPGFFGGYRCAAIALGFPIVNGRANVRAHGIPPEDVGLTLHEQSVLKDFIRLNGANLTTLKPWLSEFHPKFPWTFLRTSGGVSVWLGDDDKWTPVTGDIKGGPNTVSYYNFGSQVLWFASRTPKQKHPSAVKIRRVGNTVCMKHQILDGDIFSNNTANGRFSLPIPPQSPTVFIVWNPDGSFSAK